MTKVGLTHGGFYAHFDSKDALVAEAISHMFDDRFEAFQKCMAGVEPAAGLVRYIDLYLSVRHRDRRDVGCPVVALSGDLSRMPAVARERFEFGIQRLTDSLAAILKTLNKPQPEKLAASVLAEMVGAVAIARGVANAELSEQFLDAARASLKGRLGLTN
jgi:TetR/AcrR family transcriptional repressor of nem operon